MNAELPAINVLVVDNQFLIIEALKSIFSKNKKYALFGIVETKFELGRALAEMERGLLIIDFWTVDFFDFEEIKSFINKFPGIQILILTNNLNRSEFVELSKAGYKNILYKTTDEDEFFKALEYASKGKKYYSSRLLEMILEMNSSKQLPDESKILTCSEIEIVRLISEGLTTKEIAVNKHISYHTVNTHRKNIFRKMGVSNASELVMHAIKQGWIESIEYYI